ncbi:hypothetical protein [Bosea sp. AAP35]|uniref:hypothetical protein n=1 Tax=Bosea sp. AAP35 TaxID=1523417 RepID=UPI0012E170A9|nr:hypothetical protein [Bosea sp. AAP35]
MPSKLTRRQLYDLIWTHELPAAADHLGISEREIQRICVQHRVSAQKAAFWRAKAAGVPVKRTIFTTTMNSPLELSPSTRGKHPSPACRRAASSRCHNARAAARKTHHQSTAYQFNGKRSLIQFRLWYR